MNTPELPNLPERLQQLFRHSIATGLLNPLLHLVKRYRQDKPS